MNEQLPVPLGPPAPPVVRSPWERPRQHHVLAAALTVLLSLLLHAWLLYNLPAMRFRSGLSDDQVVRYRPFQMEQISKAPPARVQESVRFRPENPSEVREVYGEPDSQPLAEGFDLPLPEPPELNAGSLAGEGRALAPAAPTPARERWEPRQDIVQIEEQLYGEKVSSLPRRYAERVARSASAPDVVFPVASTDVAPAGGGRGVELAADSLSIPRSLARGPAGRGGAPGGLVPPPVDLVPDPRENKDLDEKREEISPMLPAEQFLSLDVRTFRPADEPDATYFEVHIARKGDQTLPVLPKDVVLIQDCSESMTSWKLAECKAGLRHALDQVGPADRLEIIGFRDQPERCFKGWAPFTDLNRARALSFIDGMRAQGNTDVYAALREVGMLERDPNRPLVAVLVTDGRPTTGESDSSHIIDAFTRANEGKVSMFSFGAGRRVNRFLLDMVSFRNRGDARVELDTDRIPGAMSEWTAGVSRPVLCDLLYRFTGLDESQVFPTTLTHLYLDRTLVIYGRLPGAPQRTAFQIIGRSGPAARDLVFEMDLNQAKPGAEDMRTRWVWLKIYDLIGHYIQTRQAAALQEVRSLAERFRLTVPYGQDIVIGP